MIVKEDCGVVDETDHDDDIDDDNEEDGEDEGDDDDNEDDDEDDDEDDNDKGLREALPCNILSNLRVKLRTGWEQIANCNYDDDEDDDDDGDDDDDDDDDDDGGGFFDWFCPRISTTNHWTEAKAKMWAFSNGHISE